LVITGYVTTLVTNIMLLLEKMKFSRTMRRTFQRVMASVFFGLLFLMTKGAYGEAYYSTSSPVQSTPYVCLATCTGVNTSVSTPVGSVAISAAANLRTLGPTYLRYQLGGTGQIGWRAGALLSTNSSLLGVNALGTVTIRTYLSSTSDPNPTVAQDEMTVSATAANLQLLAGKGSPAQFELIATKPFNQVEIVFAALANLGTTVNVNYAYGVGPNTAAQIMGLTSNASTASTAPFKVTGCTDKVNNPQQTVDSDRTNYATFSSLLTVACPAELMVGLNGTAPGTYRAGFVIGQGNNLLDVSVLSSLTIRTYKNGVVQQTASGASLLGLSVLPDGKSLVSFQANTSFDAVSIERTDAVALLDDLRLYYGVGVASLTPPQVISSFGDPTGHYQTYSNGLVCVNCGVTAPSNAAGNPNSKATINTLAGVSNSAGIRLDLNGTGNAGNRAGMVIGSGTLLDVAALSRVVLSTYDDQGNVLETATGDALLKLNLLPDGRQTVSFNTTKSFSKVGIQVSGLAGVATNTDIYYAFTDSSNGSFNIVTPTGPLPVTLTSFGVRRVASSGVAALTWTTASEVNSSSFVVERATDLVAGFTAIGRVAAAGNSSTTRTYTWQDPEAASQTGTLYYRLRQLDFDGQAHLSPVAVLSASAAKAGFTLYPNPTSASASQRVTIATSTDLSAGYSVSVYSGTGQLLSTRVVSSEGAITAPTVPTAGLAAGLYHVVLRNAAGQQLSSQRLQITGQ
jgi:hypothetical protein